MKGISIYIPNKSEDFYFKQLPPLHDGVLLISFRNMEYRPTWATQWPHITQGSTRSIFSCMQLGRRSGVFRSPALKSIHIWNLQDTGRASFTIVSWWVHILCLKGLDTCVKGKGPPFYLTMEHRILLLDYRKFPTCHEGDWSHNDILFDNRIIPYDVEWFYWVYNNLKIMGMSFA